MPTWLDEYTFHTCAAIADGLGRSADMRERMKAYCEVAAARIGTADFEGAGMDADLLPFFDDRFRNVRAAYRIAPALARGFGGAVASDEGLALLQEHVRRVNYTFIDCPPGAMPLGADVEGRAIFVKTARVTPLRGSEAVPGGMSFELVIGRIGRLSRQTLLFDRACTDHQPYDAEVTVEDGGTFEDLPVLELVARSGRGVPAIAQTMLNVAISTVAYAKLEAGGDLVRPTRRVPAADRAAARGGRAQPRMCLVDLLDLGPPGSVEGAGA